jgi:hypothetical protein
MATDLEATGGTSCKSQHVGSQAADARAPHAVTTPTMSNCCRTQWKWPMRSGGIVYAKCDAVATHKCKRVTIFERLGGAFADGWTRLCQSGESTVDCPPVSSTMFAHFMYASAGRSRALSALLSGLPLRHASAPCIGCCTRAPPWPSSHAGYKKQYLGWRTAGRIRGKSIASIMLMFTRGRNSQPCGPTQ